MGVGLGSWQQRGERRRAEVMALPVLPVVEHALIVGPDRLVRVYASIGAADELVSVWVAPSDVEAIHSVTRQEGWATFPDARTPHPVAVTVRRRHADYEVDTRITDLPLAFPMAQPMPDGQVLVVGARCRWRRSGPDLNAILYDAEGSVVMTATLGDGVEHVLTTASGNVWVGYFDEGVYGNYGWGDQESPAPIGAAGLVSFAPNLQPGWQFPVYDDRSWDPISDCYALNVDGETVWACYYTGFPIVRIFDGQIARWSNQDTHGARAIAVLGDRVALCGGYQPDRDRVVVGHLANGSFQRITEYRLVLPDGRPLPDETRLVGRGGNLHVITGDTWYRIGLDDIDT